MSVRMTATHRKAEGMTTVKTEAAFTPGPWLVETEPATHEGVMRFVGSKVRPNRSQIAHVKRLYCDNSGNETDANARLIAAAPELYEAMEEARRAIDTLDEDAFGMVFDQHTGDPAYPVRDELLAKIEAVLAKARGDAPSSKGSRDD